MGDSIRRMGSKTQARALMQAAGVPVVPGYHPRLGGEGQGVRDWADQTGYPVLVKAAAGGGGKGMRIVHQPDQLIEAIEAAQREAAKAFGDATIFLEKYIEGARHIEFQVFGDATGHVIHLFERECSTQRRHQKIIEETPSPLLDDDLRERMGQAAVAAARAVDYQNAGTIEFIVDPKTREFYFLEMNTRLQVEHPITELLTGIDLVNLQLRAAQRQPLPFAQADVSRRGHAIECRIYAEDPANNFLPAIGKVLLAQFPVAPGARVDSGLETGDEIPIHYDPMIAKVSVLGEDRADAIRKMDWALRHTIILGVATNIPFLRAVLAHPVFQHGEVTTDFIEREMGAWRPPIDGGRDLALIAAALSEVTIQRTGESANRMIAETAYDPWQVTDRFRAGG
jgi:acetyl/propionyl-CoA carboxylase alpha subunit